ncbi:hypothetical protein KSU82_20365 [Bacteroides thetaiotaomicron]|uniref:hypothetical protein n=1 Tax=Bacteroides thetaiotaomicron TaxID=818 RepID=UPI001C37B5B8|nr:hypothetical protein [Bacteroides thetaiotaomicron]MBV3105218.1 hypothetical protein [Bacteroides thetaiotaomicron]MBV3110004.1 hypothetical protein [Bacteroides thetaiotaomicron]MBV3135998.1 hypothetical protein [Bacteroides thetaiotaomicron]
MKKHIYLDKAGKGKLRQIFGCTEVMVWKALTFESDSDLARKIRFTAMKEFGGVLMGDGVYSGFETIHDTTTMTQIFSSRVKIIAHKNIDKTAVLIDGEVKQTVSGLSIPEFMNLQKEVARIASELQL